VCLDVGANYGLYTHALARLVGPTGVVHSIEPLPTAFRVLSISLALRGLGNVHRHRVALGERATTGTLRVPRRRLGLPVHGRAFLAAGSDGPGPNAEFAGLRDVGVEVVPLDELCARLGLQRVDFVKADVEGAEFAVLQGGEATLARHRPTLLLEIEQRHVAKYGHDAGALFAWLAERGYGASCWRRGTWAPVGEVRGGVRNYLFVHADRQRG
jgi:FkbM family methyltransferase